MTRELLKISGLMIVFLITMSIGTQVVEGQFYGPNIIMDFMQLMDDPTFNLPPDFIINGTSNEFSTGHHLSEGGEDYNYALLNWTHNANNSLDFKAQSVPECPDSNEFVYLYKTVTWNYEIKPQDAWLKYEYNLSLTGNFLSNPEGDDMYEMHIWFIDSSGYWKEVSSFTPSISYNREERWADLDFSEREAIFGGIIQNSEGFQEDPTDELSLCIGLAPSIHFLNYSSTEPWRTYNGSIALEIIQLELHVAADVVNNMIDQLPVVNNQTWGTPYSEYYVDYAMSDDGFIYGVAATSSYEYGIRQQSLVKWDAMANIIWSVEWNETRYADGRDISIFGDYIYTIGSERDDDIDRMIITKWDIHGNQLLKHEFENGDNDKGWELEIAPDGSFYVIGSYDTGSIEGICAFFAKYDEYGNQYWNMTVPDYISVEFSRVYIHPNGTPYTIAFPSAGLYRWTTNGTPILVDDGYGLKDITFSQSGEIYLSRSMFPYVKVDKIDNTGHLENLYTYDCAESLPEPWHEIIEADAITVTNDSIYLIIKHEYMNYYYELINLNLDGSKNWNKTILDLAWRAMWTSGSGFFMEFGQNGLLYIGSAMNTECGGSDMGLAVFNPENIPLPTTTSSTLTTTNTTNGNSGNLTVFLILGVGTIGIVITVIIIYFKKRTS